jgi:hypothetical protein
MNKQDYTNFITRVLNVAPEEIQLRIGKKMIDQMSGVSKSATYLAWNGYMNSNARKMAVRNQPNTVLKPTYDYIINKYGQGGNTNNVTVTTLSVLREKGGQELINAYGNYAKMERIKRKENQALKKIKGKRNK